ncbi:ABC transporter permease [Paenibacillus eucommiae]|uniref:Aldouronate transport system permease protein n=1 Tax=Paenibacillus eucommiae TaxID=1355755 RepID=A0ABS4J3Z0_9BACL|nr:ABC transporter permease subunit [Paenibacillus eucommiae]MBP1994528.1 putative aldouronate transport system permease protein [Paenibacillus eucommiae]
MKLKQWKRNMPLHLMILPGAILVFMFSYIPMAGIVIAFQKFVPNKGLFGSKWVGFDNFIYMINMPDIYQVIYNTVFIAAGKIIFGQLVPILVALLLNEMKNKFITRSVQTMIYLPHFLSWVILGGVLIDILSINDGIINQILSFLQIEPIYFLGSNTWFPFTVIVSDVWKEFGFATIIYLAALTSIDPSLYEAAYIDGANRLKQTQHVTLPGIAPIMVLLALLSLGNVLNAGFEQIFILYNPQVYHSGDIIDTLVYRIGFLDAQYGVSTAVNLFKSVISMILIIVSYRLVYKFANYRIF